jgi:hypothetical protein
VAEGTSGVATRATARSGKVSEPGTGDLRGMGSAGGAGALSGVGVGAGRRCGLGKGVTAVEGGDGEDTLGASGRVGWPGITFGRCRVDGEVALGCLAEGVRACEV